MSDGEMETIGSRSEAQVHNETQRPQSSAWTTSEDIYETVQTAVLCYSMWQVGKSFDEWKEEAEAARKEFVRLIGVIAAADDSTEAGVKKRATTLRGPYLGNRDII